MSRLESRDCGFNELGSRAICLTYLKSRQAIEGQSNPPTGTYRLPKLSGLASVIQYGRGRRPLQAPARPPNATESRLGYRQRVTKCINRYRLYVKNASSSVPERGVRREIRHSGGRGLNSPAQKDLRLSLLQMTRWVNTLRNQYPVLDAWTECDALPRRSASETVCWASKKQFQLSVSGSPCQSLASSDRPPNNGQIDQRCRSDPDRCQPGPMATFYCRSRRA